MGWTSEARQEVGRSRQITRRAHTRGIKGAQKGISAQGTIYMKVSVKKGDTYLGEMGMR